MQAALGPGGAGIGTLSKLSPTAPGNPASPFRTRVSPLDRIIPQKLCFPHAALGLGATVALVVTLSRHASVCRRLSPAYRVHRCLIFQLVTSANDAHFRTYIFEERLKGNIPGPADPRSLALAYTNYFAAVVELERNLHICHIFLSTDVYTELLARVCSLKSLLSAEGYPRFDIVDQTQLGSDFPLNSLDYLLSSSKHLINPSSTAPEPRNLYEVLIGNVEQCTKSSSCEKLRELDNRFVDIIQLLDPHETVSYKDVAAFIPDENHKFPARKKSSSGFFNKVVRAIMEAGAGAVQLLTKQVQ